MGRAPIILLVEDDSNDRELARIALQRAPVPHTLEVVRDGPEALDWLFSRAEFTGRDGGMSPCLILLDLKLPKMDGLEVLDQIRRHPRTKLVPVVVFTSSLEERDLKESYQLGANGYVRKPVDFGEYKKVIAEVGTFWVRHNLLPIHGPPPGTVT
jgi:two-component system response regulator